MNESFKIQSKEVVLVSGEKFKEIYLTSDWAPDGVRYNKDSNMRDGTPSVAFVGEELANPAGRISCDQPELLVPLMLEFVAKNIPTHLASFVRACVKIEVKEALASLRASEKSAGAVISNQPPADIYHTPMRESTRPPAVNDPQLGRLA
jgi:hypothetical protein